MYPAFAEHVAWHVFRQGVPGNEAFLVRRVTWDQHGDADRLLDNPMQGLKDGFHSSPTIESRDRPIETGIVIEHLDRLGQLSIPIGAIDGTVRLDGTAFSLERLAGRVLFEWRDSHPPEWHALVAWFEDFRMWLDDACTQPGTPQCAPLVAHPSA